MVEQSQTTPESICKEYMNHPLGLTLSTPGLVSYQFQRLWDKDVVPCDDDWVESDVRGEMLPQPLVIPDIIRVLEQRCQQGRTLSLAA